MNALSTSLGANALAAEIVHEGADAASVTIPDAHFLFHADFKRTGSDLTLTGEDGHRMVVPGYFKYDKLPVLLSPEGAALTGDIVAALAGPLAPGQYAQATPAPSSAQAIGRVASVTGGVTAVRNGVAITLNVGDTVLKGDVIQTASGSTTGIYFNDGTTFTLTANARMVLNDFVYDQAATSGNSAVISLVQGSFTFLAGQVAHTGDMRVSTPAAVMGIRGTAVQVDINVNNGQTTMSVLVEPALTPNGTPISGVFNVYALGPPGSPPGTLGPQLATVSNPGTNTVVTPSGPLQAVASEVQKSPAEVAQALVLVQQVFQQQSFGAALTGPNSPVNPNNPNAPTLPPPPDQNPNPNPTPDKQGSSTPTQILANKIVVTVGDNGPAHPATTDIAVTPLPPSPPPPPTLLSPPPPPPLPPTPPPAPPQITATTPPHLVEAANHNDGTGFASSTISLSGGTLPTYDTSALLADHWVDRGDGLFAKEATYGTVVLDTATNTLKYFLDNSRVDTLGAGDNTTESFTIPVHDGPTALSTTVEFVVEGRNDSPRFGLESDLSFESHHHPLAHWQVVGTASRVDGGTDGTHAIQLQSDPAAADGQPGSASAGDIATFLGLAPDALAVANGQGGTNNPTVGSAIERDFVLAAGQTISFDWEFVTSDSTPSNDFAFVSIDGFVIKLSDVLTVEDDGSSGWQTMSFTAPISGTYQFGFGVLDAGGDDGPSYLLIDNIRGVTNEIGKLDYTAQQAAAAIAYNLTLADPDSANLTGATVKITGNFHSDQDVLGFADQNGIHGSYDPETGILTLTGSASVADYQEALRSVTYFNSKINPSGDTRTISYQADDGSSLNHASEIGSATICVTTFNIAPTIDHTPIITEIPIPNPLPDGADPAAVNEIAPAMSGDGRWVVFFSDETLPTNGSETDRGDVFLYDRLTGVTKTLTDSDHIPARADGELFSGFSINASGSTLVFAGDHQVGDFNENVRNVYVYDRASDTVHLLTNPADGNAAYDINDLPRIAGGGLIAFAETDFGDGTQPPTHHVLVTDTAGNIRTDITAQSLGIADGNVDLEAADISSNGRYLTVWAVQHDPQTFDPTGFTTLYTYDRVTQSHQAIATTTATDDPWWASMSDDGRYVVFQSDVSLTDAPTNGHNNIYVWDRLGAPGSQIIGVTDRDDFQADGDSSRASISGNGRYVIFSSNGDNFPIGSDDTNNAADTFVYDLQSHTFQRVSVGPDGVIQGDGDSSYGADLSFGGSFAAFGSTAGNLVAPNDTDGGQSDVFVVDRSAGTLGAVFEDDTTPGATIGGLPANSLSTHGAFAFSDLDLSDSHTVEVTGPTIDTSGAPAGFTVPAEGLGTFTPTVVEFAGSGHGQVAWTFWVDNALVQGLNAFQQVRQTYTVQLSDGNDVVTQDVTVVIAGAADAPVLTLPGHSASVSEDNTLSFAGASVSDADVSDTITLNLIATHGSLTPNGSLPAGITVDDGDGSDGTLQIHGSTAAISNALTNGVSFTPASNYNGLATLTVKVQDSVGLSDTQQVAITVNPVNDAPVLGVTGGASANLVQNGGFETNPFGGTVFSISGSSIPSWFISSGNIDLQKDIWAPAAGHYSLDLSGNVAGTIQQTLATTAGVTYTVTFDMAGNADPGNNPTGLHHAMLVSAAGVSQEFDFDSTGHNNLVDIGWTPKTFTFTATGPSTTLTFASLDHGNSGPTLDEVQATYNKISVTEDTPTALTALTVADVDSGGSPITVTLSLAPGAGSLTATSAAGVAVGGNATALTLTGSAADINSFLGNPAMSVTYTPAADLDTDVVLTVSANDNGATGAGGPQTTTLGVLLDIAPVNDAPVNTVPGAQTVNENTDRSITDISIADVDAASSSITTTLSVGGGTLAVAAVGGAGVSGSGTGTVVITGTVAQINATLSAANNVVYRGALNFTGDDTLTVTTNDGGATGAGGAKSDTDTVVINISAVNDAPVLNANGGGLAYTENQAPSAIDTAITVSDVDNASLTGATVAITGNFQSGQDVLSVADQNGIHGDYNASTGVLALTGTATVTQYQAALRSVQYSNSSDDPSTAPRTVSFTVDDGQAANHASNTVTATVTVAAVNDAPVVAHAIADQSSPEDQAWSFQVPASTFADVDNATLTYSATLDDDTALPAWLSFNAATQTFSGTPPQDFNGQFSLKVTASDGALTASDTFTLTVTPVNGAPVLTLPGNSSSLDEDTSTPFTNAHVSDPDAGDVITLNLSVAHGSLARIGSLPAGVTVDDDDGSDGTLQIHGSAVAIDVALTNGVTYQPAPNYNGPDTLTVGVHDLANASDSKQIAITVNSVNDAPSGTDKTISTNEDTAYVFQASDFGFTDPNDSPPNAFAVLVIDTLPAAGTLTKNGVAVSAGQSMPVSDIGQLVFTPAANANGNGYASFTFQVQDDGGHGGAGGVGVDLDPSPNTITFNVTPVNNAPTIAGTPTMPAFDEDTAPSVQTIAHLYNGHFQDVDAGATLAGVAVYLGSGPSNTLVGTWQYSVDSGATWHGIGPFGQANTYLVLQASAELKFVPVLDFNGVANLNVAVVDNSYAGTFTDNNGEVKLVSPALGGMSSISNPAGISVTVNPVNDAPVLSNVAATAAYTEGGAAATLSPALNVTDVDNTNLSSATVHISGGAFANDGDVLSATASGTSIAASYDGATETLTLFGTDTLAHYKQVLDSVTFSSSSGNPTNSGANSTRTIDWQADDGAGGLSAVQHTTLTITAVNNPPVVAHAIADQSSPEDQAWSFQVPANTFSDVDNATLTYTATLDDDTALPGWLAFNPATQMFSGTPPQDFNGQLSLKVTASDGELGASDTFTLTVTPVNDAPVLGVVAANSTFQTLTYPTPSNDIEAYGLNNAGQVVGEYTVNDVVHGFLYSNGSYSTIDDPSAVGGTIAYGINNGAQIVGVGIDGGGVDHGFLYSNGIFSPVNDPLGVGGTDAVGINDRGQIVGSYVDSDGNTHGFLYSDGGFTTIDNPAAVDVSFFSGINSSGEIVGGYGDAHGTGHAFLYSNGNFTSLDDPLGVAGSIAVGINDAAQVVGFYLDGTGQWHGFLYSDGTFATIDDPLNSTGYNLGSTAVGINDVGQIAGTYNSSGTQISFLRGADTPYTEDGAAVSLTAGVGVLDSDSAHLMGATVKISAGFVDGDILSVDTAGTGIGASYDSATGTLTLIGSTSAAAYEQVLDSVQFSSSSGNATNFGTDPTRTIDWQVNDGSELSAVQHTTVTVTAVNDAPVVAHAIADQSSPEDQAWSFQVPANTFSDADNATLTYSATLDDGNPLPPDWLSFNPATQTFSGTPPQDFNGQLSLKVTASDGSLSASDTFTLTVTPVNDAPVVDLDTSHGGSGYEANLVADGNPLPINFQPAVTDVDSANMEGASIVLTQGQAGDFFFVPSFDGGPADGITTAISGVAGDLQDPLTITLSGHATSEAYAYALSQVSFGSSSTSSGDRAISVSVNDGVDNSVPATATIHVSALAVPDAAPQISILQPVAFGIFGNATNDADVTDVTYAGGHIYLTVDKLPVTQTTADSSVVTGFDLNDGVPALHLSLSWSKGFLSGIAADANTIYAVGGSNPGTGLTQDTVGGAEDKSILVRFNADGTAGSNPAPAIGTTSNNFFAYNGVETFQNALATTQGGNTVIYAVGGGQPASYGAYIIAEYDSNGTLLHSATDPLPVPGYSIARDAVEFNGGIWAVGGGWHQSQGEPVNHDIPTVWQASYDLGTVQTHQDLTGAPDGDFYSAAVLGDSLYAVGNVAANGGDYIIAKYDTSGQVVWSVTGGGSGADTLTGAVALNGHLFAVGKTTTANGDTDGVLLEINPTDGSVIGQENFGSNLNDSANAITTDGTHIYIAGNANFTPGGLQDFFLATDAIAGGSVSTAEDTALALTGIAISDADAGTSQIKVTLAVSNGTLSLDETGLDAGSTNNGASIDLYGSQDAINAALKSGVTYTPNADYNGADSLSIAVDDQAGQISTASLDINVTPVNDAPVLSNVAATAAYTEGGAAATLSPALNVTDVDSTNLQSARVHISDGAFADDGDVLSATVTGNISQSYDSATETLTLTGSDTLAHYKQVLDSVTFSSTSGNPSNSGANSSRTIDWQVTDSAGGPSAVQHTTLTINTVNNPPDAVNDSFDTTYGNELVIAPEEVLANDTDSDLDTLGVDSVQGAVGGTVALIEGNIMFTPTEGFFGPASFTYTASDGQATDTATVAVAVTEPNWAGFDAKLSVEGHLGVRGAWTSGNSVQFDMLLSPAAGTLTIVANDVENAALDGGAGEIDQVFVNGHYVGNLAQTGVDGADSTTNLSIDQSILLSGYNHVEIYNTSTPGTSNFTVVSASYSVPDTGFVASIAPDSENAGHTAPNGNLGVRAAWLPGHADTFDIVLPTAGQFQGAAITIGANDVEVPDQVSVNGERDQVWILNTPTGDHLLGYLTQSADGTDATTTLNIDSSYLVGGANHFSVFNANDPVTDTPVPWNFSINSVVLTGARTVDAADDSFTTDEDTPFSDSVATNDTTPLGGPLSYGLVTEPDHGVLNFDNSDGSFTYTPLADYSGPDSFTYTAIDGALSDTATVTINVNPVNDAPTISVTAPDNHVVSNTGGTNRSVHLSNLGISGDSAVTVEFWFSDTTATYSLPFGFYLYDLLVINDSGHTYIGFNTGNADLYYVDRPDLVGQWHHVAAVFVNGDAGAAQLYIDGQLQTLAHSASPNNAVAVISDSAAIGEYLAPPPAQQNTLEGSVDEVRIWHGALTATQIADTMNIALTGPQPGLVATYSFDNVSNGPDGVPDVSGNDHPGTLRNLTTANIVTDPTLALEPSVANNQTLVFSAANHNQIAVNDVDDTNLSVTLSVDHGILTLATQAGLSVTDDGTAAVTLSGTTSAINAALDGLTYQPDDGYTGADALTVSAGDGTDSSDTHVDLFVTPGAPESPAPVLTASSGASEWDQNPHQVHVTPVDPDITVSDADSDTLDRAIITITGNFIPTEDRLSFDNNHAELFGDIYTSNNFAISGFLELQPDGIADLEQWQNALENVVYSNISDSPTEGDRTISFTVYDPDNNVSNVVTKVIHVVSDRDTWTGLGGDDSWFNAGNWDHGVPTANNVVVFNSASAVVDTLNGSDFPTIAGLVVSSGATVNLSLDPLIHQLTVDLGTTVDGTLNIANDRPGTSSAEMDLQGLAVSGVVIAQADVDLIVSGPTSVTGVGLIAANADGYIEFDGDLVLTADSTSVPSVETSAGGVINVFGSVTNSHAFIEALGGEIDLGGDVANTGTIVAGLGGQILAEDVEINNIGPGLDDDGNPVIGSFGSILAQGDGSIVTLYDATVIAGELGTQDGGIIQVESGQDIGVSVFDGSSGYAVTIDSGSLIQVVADDDPTASLELRGTIVNQGTIDLGLNTHLAINGDYGDVMLDGAGEIILHSETSPGGASSDIIGGPTGGTLENVSNTIHGAGAITDGDGGGAVLTLVNDAGGTIVAEGGTLTIDTVHCIINHGTLRAAGGELHILSDVENSGTIETLVPAESNGRVVLETAKIDNAGGTIVAHSFGSEIEINDSQVIGGTIGDGAGSITVTGDTTFDGATSDLTINLGALVVVNDAALHLLGSIHNAGQINFSTISNSLVLDDSVTLDGGGSIYLIGSSAPHSIQVAEGVSVELDNVDNTIGGGGVIGEGDERLTLVNEVGGQIQALEDLTIDTGTNSIENYGYIEAVGRELDIESAVNNYNSGAAGFSIIKANGSGGVVNINNFVDNFGAIGAENSGDVFINADITNESLGAIYAAFDGTVTINSTVDNFGTVVAESGTIVVADGATITNESGGIVKIGTGTLEFQDDSNTDVAFDNEVPGGGGLVLDALTTFSGHVSGFTFDDVIDFAGVDFTPTTSLSYDSNTGVLAVTDGSDTQSVILNALPGHTYQLADFFLRNDGNGHTGVLAEPALTQTAPSAILVEQGVDEHNVPVPGVATSSVTITFNNISDDDVGFVTRVFDPENGHYYAFIPTTVGASWEADAADAALRGGHLATITSAAEDTFIRTSVLGSNLAYIGATDHGHNGVWQWAAGPEDGTTFWNGNSGGSAPPGEYANWRPGEPNDFGGSEDYGLLDVNGWNDVSDSYEFQAGYILELDSSPFQGIYGYADLDILTGLVTYHLDDSRAATQALHAGDHVTDVINIPLVTATGAVGTDPISFSITGTNDAPTITSDASAAVGSVTEDGVQIASGQLAAIDPEGDAITWTIEGGSRVDAPGYQFAIDDFQVAKTVMGVPDTVIFDDPFDGTVPPAGPNFTTGTTPSPIYFTSSGTFVGDIDGASRNVAAIDGSNAGFAGVTASGSLVFGQFATLNTNVQPMSTLGLKSGQAFKASTIFDLIAPSAANESYGIRLIDRVTTGPSAQPGTETVELAVIAGADPGTAQVQLREINFATGMATVLQTIAIDNPGGDDQIMLSLANDPASNGNIQASFVLGHDGTADEATRTPFSATGRVFDNETWTRAQFFGSAHAVADASPTADSYIAGTYGVLDINQSGAWTYAINNGQANVQALAAGQVVQDTFNVQVADGNGGVSTQTITVDVHGTNDVPVIVSEDQAVVSRGGSVVLTTINLHGIDIDASFDQRTYAVTDAANGWLARADDPNAPITHFTDAELRAGDILFVNDGSGSALGSFTVTLSDGLATSAPLTVDVAVTSVSAEEWSEARFPDPAFQNRHLFGVNPQVNGFGGFIALGYRSSFDYTPGSNYDSTNNLALLDPFFLPEGQVQWLGTETVQPPARSFFITPNISTPSGLAPEGIYLYKAQANPDGTGSNVITRLTSDDNFQHYFVSQIGNASTTQNTNYNLTASFRTDSGTGALANYVVVWDQYQSNGDGTGSYKVYFQTFDPSDNPLSASPVLTPVDGTVTEVNSQPVLPAYFLNNGGGAYMLAYATPSNQTGTVGSLNLTSLGLIGQTFDSIHFTAYHTDGTLNPGGPNFTVYPDVSAHPGAQNHITQQIIPAISQYPGQGVQQLQWQQMSDNNNVTAVGWNETVTYTDGSGEHTYDQVEFDVIRSGSGAIFHQVIDVPDDEVQNIRVRQFSDPGTGSDYFVLVYGDDTGTHIREYAVTTDNSPTANTTHVTEIAELFDPTTQVFDNATSLSDGRIAIIYNEYVNGLPDETTQFDFRIFDLRTTGLSSPTLSTQHDNFIAGTHFDDTVTGANGVGNAYYYVGANTPDAGPNDVFNGGSGGWNVAIMADDRINYALGLGDPGTTIFTDESAAHHGSLALNGVQAVAFAPTVDPMPDDSGEVHATGDALVILNAIGNHLDVSGGTDIELAGLNGGFASVGNASGGLSFQGYGSTLQLDDAASGPNQLSGLIDGFAGNFIDLVGWDINSASTSTVFDGIGTSTVTVSDATHQATDAYQFSIAGDLTGVPIYVMDDGHGNPMIGTDHAPQAHFDTVIATLDAISADPIVIPSYLLTWNDTDADADNLFITSVDDSQSFGTVQSFSSGILYTKSADFQPPLPGQSAVDQFGYTVQDNAGVTSSTHVTLIAKGDANISGTPGGDILIVGAGDHVMTGLAGSDTFVFHGGDVTITDFDQGNAGSFDLAEGDRVDLPGLDLTAAALQTLLDNAVNDTITFGNGSTLTLTNTHLPQHQVTAANFIVHHADFG